MYRKNICLISGVMLIFICSACVILPYSEDYRTYEEEDGLLYQEMGDDGDPPLIIAAKSNNFKLISNLIRDGVNTNVENYDGKTPLWYAFDHGNFEAFKILMENGARSDFLNYEMASDSYRKIKLYKLAKEYRMLNRIKKYGNRNEIRYFDAYFSEFSNGYYVAKVEKIFERMVRKNYLRASKSPTDLQNFMKKYLAMGQNCYLVMTDGLNIRVGNSTGTKKIGEYIKGERVFSRSKKGEWIKTDRGWIHTKHTAQIIKSIPVLWPYLRKAAQQTGINISPGTEPPRTEPPSPTEPPPRAKPPSRTKPPSRAIPAGIRTEQPKTEPEQPKTEPEQPKTEPEAESPPLENTGNKAAEAKKELDLMLKRLRPNLSDLQAFIDKYKNQKGCGAVVDRAKKEYRAILLKGL